MGRVDVSSCIYVGGSSQTPDPGVSTEDCGKKVHSRGLSRPVSAVRPTHCCHTTKCGTRWPGVLSAHGSRNREQETVPLIESCSCCDGTTCLTCKVHRLF